MQICIVVGCDKVDEEVDTEGSRDHMPGYLQLGCLQLGESQEEGHHHRVQHDQSIVKNDYADSYLNFCGIRC